MNQKSSNELRVRYTRRRALISNKKRLFQFLFGGHGSSQKY